MVDSDSILLSVIGVFFFTMICCCGFWLVKSVISQYFRDAAPDVLLEGETVVNKENERQKDPAPTAFESAAISIGLDTTAYVARNANQGNSHDLFENSTVAVGQQQPQQLEDNFSDILGAETVAPELDV